MKESGHAAVYSESVDTTNRIRRIMADGNLYPKSPQGGAAVTLALMGLEHSTAAVATAENSPLSTWTLIRPALEALARAAAVRVMDPQEFENIRKGRNPREVLDSKTATALNDIFLYEQAEVPKVARRVEKTFGRVTTNMRANIKACGGKDDPWPVRRMLHAAVHSQFYWARRYHREHGGWSTGLDAEYQQEAAYLAMAVFQVAVHFIMTICEAPKEVSQRVLKELEGWQAFKAQQKMSGGTARNDATE